MVVASGDNKMPGNCRAFAGHFAGHLAEVCRAFAGRFAGHLLGI
jgi:hypothetical protein